MSESVLNFGFKSLEDVLLSGPSMSSGLLMRRNVPLRTWVLLDVVREQSLFSPSEIHSKLLLPLRAPSLPGACLLRLLHWRLGGPLLPNSSGNEVTQRLLRLWMTGSCKLPVPFRLAVPALSSGCWSSVAGGFSSSLPAKRRQVGSGPPPLGACTFSGVSQKTCCRISSALRQLSAWMNMPRACRLQRLSPVRKIRAMIRPFSSAPPGIS
mmetsp:Transcript_101474/g.302677  ORF Transcript_101474/g.302677 Transcript_101474/m.302677 type:complete len:210 (-) Transcript_101474:1071-1700(-)